MIDREEQIRLLLPLVRRIARRIARVVGGADLDDLVGDGSVGLIRAVDSFDPRYGVSLEHYARRVIAGAMLNGIRRLDPVSERVRRTLREAERERYALATERGELPAMLEMEQRVPALKRARTEAHRGTPISIDAPLPMGERFDLSEADDPQLLAEQDAQRRRVRDAIESLPPRERRLVFAHYFSERSLRALSGDMAVSPQRVSQLHLIALARMRRGLARGA
ncbi:MAG: sigma-70 family RNA polymerase sigma factor [Candidatus Velthaea sp.]|jgi:RNA polymerase sigma factor for flagellar operon FliA